MILNLTQHKATADQRSAGVIDIPTQFEAELVSLLTFRSISETAKSEIDKRVNGLVRLVVSVASAIDNTLPIDPEIGFNPIIGAVMLGGPLFLMGPLAVAIEEAGYQPLFAFSRRESEEQTLSDGSVRKIQVFKHLGFVEALNKVPTPLSKQEAKEVLEIVYKNDLKKNIEHLLDLLGAASSIGTSDDMFSVSDRAAKAKKAAEKILSGLARSTDR
jgi:hypothetical protein